LKNYSTEQRKLLLSFLKNHCDAQFTVEEIAAQLHGGCSISVSSVYRNIDRLVTDGSVRRFAREGGRGSLYQYFDGQECAGHLHLKCTKCGQIFHLDDEAAAIVLAAALEKNDFSVDESKTVLYGLCKSCR
jgi:Fur family ferric uptake transcriptional regulator